MTVLPVGDLDFGTEGQRLVRRGHRAIAERYTLAVLVPGCDGSPTAYTDATQSSARTGTSSKQTKSAAINRRMHNLEFGWLAALAPS